MNLELFIVLVCHTLTIINIRVWITKFINVSIWIIDRVPENVVLFYVSWNSINYSTWYINRLVAHIFIVSYNNIIKPHRTFRIIGYGGVVAEVCEYAVPKT